MKVVFRVDASIKIGSGHVMRCLTLADCLLSQGAEVVFVAREHPGHMCDFIVEKGFEVHRLSAVPPLDVPYGLENSGYADWLGVDQESDAEDTVKAWGSAKIDWLIVDHYGIDSRWERYVRPVTEHIFVIDDLANRTHDCDVLLDQNYFLNSCDRYRDLLPKQAQQLLGPSYALIREEFRPFIARPKPIDPGCKQLMVFFGAVDPTNETTKVLRALQSLRHKPASVDVVIGALNANADSIETLGASLPFVRCHRHVREMATLMGHTDLFIGAGGTTTWERCCIGVPSLVLSIADNQVETLRALAETGHIVYAGPAEQVSEDMLVHAIETLMRNTYLRKSLSSASQSLVHGRGTIWVSQILADRSFIAKGTEGRC